MRGQVADQHANSRHELIQTSVAGALFSGLSNLSSDAKQKAVLFGAALELLSKVFQVPFLNAEQTQASNTSDLEIIHIACFFTEIMFGVLHGK